MVTYTETQKKRFIELGVTGENYNEVFENVGDREKSFKKIEKKWIGINREKTKDFLAHKKRTTSVIVQDTLSTWLREELGYSQVVTPTFINRQMLQKMTINEDHPLYQQVFWIDDKKCLRPMLAPNLYEMMRQLKEVSHQTVKIFEVGSCFRKESQGSEHLNEFTMLNLVQYGGISEGTQMSVLKKLASEAMQVLKIDNYQLEIETSEVYGQTLDIIVNNIELASGSYGPHPLDYQWGVFHSWVGIGFGIERLAMTLDQTHNIKKVGRGLTYLDGACLNIK